MFKYTAVIIEPREHKALNFVLENFFRNLSDDWGFIIFHGRKNKEFVKNIVENDLIHYKNRIYKLVELEVDNLNIENYNKICKNSNFYKCIPTEIILIFQTDTIIFEQNKHQINDFLQYDYVGAPWENGIVGNGGLSLRRKTKMIEICENVNYEIHPHEDNYFCYQHTIQLNRPNFNEAQKFSVETIFHEKSFGCHACWKYLNRYEMEFLLNKYPELKILIKLNDETHVIDN